MAKFKDFINNSKSQTTPVRITEDIPFDVFKNKKVQQGIKEKYYWDLKSRKFAVEIEVSPENFDDYAGDGDEMDLDSIVDELDSIVDELERDFDESDAIRERYGDKFTEPYEFNEFLRDEMINEQKAINDLKQEVKNANDPSDVIGTGHFEHTVILQFLQNLYDEFDTSSPESFSILGSTRPTQSTIDWDEVESKLHDLMIDTVDNKGRKIKSFKKMLKQAKKNKDFEKVKQIQGAIKNVNLKYFKIDTQEILDGYVIGPNLRIIGKTKDGEIQYDNLITDKIALRSVTTRTQPEKDFIKALRDYDKELEKRSPNDFSIWALNTDLFQNYYAKGGEKSVHVLMEYRVEIDVTKDYNNPQDTIVHNNDREPYPNYYEELIARYPITVSDYTKNKKAFDDMNILNGVPYEWGVTLQQKKTKNSLLTNLKEELESIFDSVSSSMWKKEIESSSQKNTHDFGKDFFVEFTDYTFVAGEDSQEFDERKRKFKFNLVPTEKELRIPFKVNEYNSMSFELVSLLDIPSKDSDRIASIVFDTTTRQFEFRLHRKDGKYFNNDTSNSTDSFDMLIYKATREFEDTYEDIMSNENMGNLRGRTGKLSLQVIYDKMNAIVADYIEKNEVEEKIEGLLNYIDWHESARMNYILDAAQSIQNSREYGRSRSNDSDSYVQGGKEWARKNLGRDWQSRWEIVWDASTAVEFKTAGKGIRERDIPQFMEDLDTLSELKTSGNKSCHIHIDRSYGDEDLFTVLAMIQLIDPEIDIESNPKLVGKGRRGPAERYAQSMKPQLANKLPDQFTSENDLGKPKALTERYHRDILQPGKFWGIHEHDDYPTVEFRYPSSTLLNNPEQIIDNVMYFTNLVEIARNKKLVRFRLHNSPYYLVAVRNNGDPMFTIIESPKYDRKLLSKEMLELVQKHS